MFPNYQAIIKFYTLDYAIISLQATCHVWVRCMRVCAYAFVCLVHGYVSDTKLTMRYGESLPNNFAM